MRRLRPAFVVPVLVSSACSNEVTSNPPGTFVPTSQSASAVAAGSTSAPSASASPSGSASAQSLRKRAGKREKPAVRKEAARGAYVSLHPRDANGRFIELAADDSCFVVVPKTTPPPKDLHTGERWTDNLPVDCPPDFDDPAWNAISSGESLSWDEKTGKCAFVPWLGNPPPPPVEATCPQTLPKKK